MQHPEPYVRARREREKGEHAASSDEEKIDVNV
jgi:hypothetical protein